MNSPPGLPAWSLPAPSATNAPRVHAVTVMSPMAATPISLPSISCMGVTEESKSSTMRLDFSSITLVSRIPAMLKIEIISM